MPTWSRTLDEAGVSDPLLRRDYTEQRRLVARFARAEYMAVRLLLPAAVVPDVIAATAFMTTATTSSIKAPSTSG